MTGFGRGTASLEDAAFTVEVSSVNHRFMDATLRLPFEWSALEPALREVLKIRVGRGKISVAVRRTRGPHTSRALQFDAEVAKSYVDASEWQGKTG